MWEAQSADDPQLFIRTLKQRMIEESGNNWLIKLNSSSRYYVYKLYKQFRYKKNYLNVISSGISRTVASRFRMGVSPIMTHKLIGLFRTVTLYGLCVWKKRKTIYTSFFIVQFIMIYV